MSFEETITVQWSSCLETLADELLKSITSQSCTPFDKICIVVNDSATENWLKHYFLLDRQIPRILMNLEFVRLPEFLNDWLAALVHGTDPRQRRAALHPYSPGVLTWRIYRILGDADPDGELAELLHYIGKEGAPLRRYALAAQLAKLYDDYQNSRFQMLRNWETLRSGGSDEVPDWQPALYRMLVRENPRSYARDYEAAFRPGTDAAEALRHGFPRYRMIHVFDIPFMPEPMLRLLEKISEAIPLCVWCFNPQSEWLANTPSRHEAVSEIRRQLELRQAMTRHRETLQAGENPPEVKLFDVADFYDSPEERLFGTFASGARAVLWNWCLDTNTDTAGTGEAIEELKEREIFIHRNYSPRRELEAIRDGLCDFFRRNPNAGPGDAVVLFADWEDYAPVIESVFGAGTEDNNTVPVTVAGGTFGDTPFTQSFKSLLAFRENCFEVDAVFDLLGFPAIREKFGLDAQSVEVLRDMVKKANIHWGFDEEDVRQTLKMTPEETASRGDSGNPWPFTWRRGFDRLIAEMLYGFSGEETLLKELGTLRDLHPCGSMEADRAGYAAALWDFVSRLHELRGKLAPGAEYPAEEAATVLQWVLDTFYQSGEQTVKAMIALRKAIRGVSDALKVSNVTVISSDVFIAAAEAAVTGFSPGMRTPGNSVLFAPLNTYTATPHKLVWVCGLNDGAFPRIENRPSYDLIGKHPSLFDTAAREKGAFALLKAVLGARKQLSLSYVGKDIRTNEEIPPSVLLNDLLDYFQAVHIPVTTYDHPMHAHSRRYFYRNPGDGGENATLPPSSSVRDEAIARMLREGNGASGIGIAAFSFAPESVTEVRLESLSDFFAAPNRYLVESRGAKVPECRFDRLESREALSPRLRRKLKRQVALTGECGPESALLMVEWGTAPDEPSARAEIDKIVQENAAARCLTFAAKNARFNCLKADGEFATFADAYSRFLEENPGGTSGVETSLELAVDGAPVLLKMELPHPVELNTPEGAQRFLVFCEDSMDVSVRNRIWLRHLGANASGGETATFLFGIRAKETGTLFLPLSREEALARLTEILKLAATPLPPDYPNWEKLVQDDSFPPEWPRTLWQEGDAINTYQKRKS